MRDSRLSLTYNLAWKSARKAWSFIVESKNIESLYLNEMAFQCDMPYYLLAGHPLGGVLLTAIEWEVVARWYNSLRQRSMITAPAYQSAI
jgi:hypothetical protein